MNTTSRTLAVLMLVSARTVLAGGGEEPVKAAPRAVILAEKTQVKAITPAAPTKLRVSKDYLKMAPTERLESVSQQLRVLPTKAIKGQPTEVAEIETALETVVTEGSRQERYAALNQLAYLDLKSGNNERALERLQAIDKGALPERDRAIINLNEAKAYTTVGQPQEALSRYRAVLQDIPRYQPAIQGVFETLEATPEISLSEWTEVCDDLLEKGQASAVRPWLWKFVRAHGEQAESLRQLAPLFLRLYIKEGLLPEEFAASERGTWREFLGGLRRNRSQLRAWKEFADQLDTVFLGRAIEGQPMAYLEDIDWIAGGSDNWGRLLSVIAEEYAWNDELEMAIPRYLAAFSQARQELDYASAALSLIRQNPARWDAEDEAVGWVVGSIFEVKGGAYRSRNWPQIYRTHLALAGIFEDRGTYRSPDRGAWSANFQLEGAIRARERLDLPPDPWLETRLEIAQKALARNWPADLAASARLQGALRLGMETEATDAYVLLERMKHELSGDTRRSLAALSNRYPEAFDWGVFNLR